MGDNEPYLLTCLLHEEPRSPKTPRLHVRRGIAYERRGVHRYAVRQGRDHEPSASALDRHHVQKAFAGGEKELVVVDGESTAVDAR